MPELPNLVKVDVTNGNVALTLSVVPINFEIKNIDSILFNVLNVDVPNNVSTLI